MLNSSDPCLGFGLLKGRKILLTADDFTIRAGHADGGHHQKTVCRRCNRLQSRLWLMNPLAVPGEAGSFSASTCD